MVTGNADVTPSAAAILHLYTGLGTKILIALRNRHPTGVAVTIRPVEIVAVDAG